MMKINIKSLTNIYTGDRLEFWEETQNAKGAGDGWIGEWSNPVLVSSIDHWSK